jgi:microcystin-dependent protein
VSNPFLGEIRIFAGNFAPSGWALCDGQLMVISQNTALFSLFGTTFGGDGRLNFGLPNLQGSAPMNPGQGSGLSDHYLGEVGGEQTVTLQQSEIPSHPHSLMASPRNADLNNPGPQNSLARSTPAYIYKQPAGANPPSPLNPNVVGLSGNGRPHNNMQPYQCVTFIVALQGVFPSRG